MSPPLKLDQTTADKKYLMEHYPEGVPSRADYPRKALKADLLNRDRNLHPLDESTLKKAIDEHTATRAASVLIRSDPIRT